MKPDANDGKSPIEFNALQFIENMMQSCYHASQGFNAALNVKM